MSRKNTELDFWHLAGGEPDGDACWLWRGAVTSRGYGTLGWQGKQALAHRLAYELTYGTIPAGLVIRHRCDTPRCCNPRHLETGTQAENMQDCVGRGRKNPARGARVRSSKLTPELVAEARRLRASGALLRDIAAALGVTTATVQKAVTGKTWSHVHH